MDPHLIRRSRPVNNDSFCVSAYLPSRCTACPVVSFCHSGQCIHRLTYLDDSSTSAVSQLKTFAYPFSQPIRIPMKKKLYKKKKTQFQRTQQNTGVQNLVGLSLVLSTVYTQDTGHRGELFHRLPSTRPRTRLDANE